MTIERTIDGKPVTIKLTDRELLFAYTEQEFKFDREDCENVIADMEDDEVLAEYGVDTETFQSLLDDMAAEKRRNIDKYGLDWDDARNEAVKTVIQRHLATKPVPGAVMETTIQIPEDVAEKIKAYLNAETEDEFQDEDEPITYTACFVDGIKMDVMCCGCQNDPSWTQAVLFSPEGYELCCSEPEEEFFGPWDLEYKGVTYHVDVEIRRLW